MAVDQVLHNQKAVNIGIVNNDLTFVASINIIRINDANSNITIWLNKRWREGGGGGIWHTQCYWKYVIYYRRSTRDQRVVYILSGMMVFS